MEAQKLAQIMKNLNDPDGQKRRSAIETMHFDEMDDSLLRILVQKLEDENKGVRDAAFQYLKNVDHKLLPKLLVPFFFYRELEIKNLAVDLMVGFGETATPQLIELLHSTNPDAQKSSAEVITILKAHGAVDALLGHLNDPDPNVSFASIEALGEIGDYKAVEPLIDVFKNSEDLREVAIESLGKILSRRVPDDFMNALYDEDPMIVYSVVDALGKIGEPKALDILLEIFPEADELIQSEILKAVGKIIRSSRFFILPEFLIDVVKNSYLKEDMEGKEDLLQILSRINSANALEFLSRAHREFEDENWQMSVFNALVSFLTLFPERGINYLEQTDDEELTIGFISHFPATKQNVLFNFLSQTMIQEQENPSLFQSALYYSAMFDTPESLDLIKSVLTGGDEEIIGVVLQALNEISIEPLLDELAGLLKIANEETSHIILKLFGNQPSASLHESLFNIFPELTDTIKINSLVFLPELIEKNKDLITNTLKGEDVNTIMTAFQVVESSPDLFNADEIKHLLHSKESEIRLKVIQLTGQIWPDVFEEEIKKAKDDYELSNDFLSAALDNGISISLPVLDYLNENIVKESLPLLRQLLINSEDENIYKKLIKDLQEMPDNDIEYYVEAAQTNNKEMFIVSLLQQLKGHDEIKDKFSSFLTDGY